jgi:hypothetical protein
VVYGSATKIYQLEKITTKQTENRRHPAGKMELPSLAGGCRA